MDRGQVHALLNQVKLGMYVSQSKINEALYVTGDLNSDGCTLIVVQNRERSIYDRTKELHDGFSWLKEWNERRK